MLSIAYTGSEIELSAPALEFRRFGAQLGILSENMTLPLGQPTGGATTNNFTELELHVTDDFTDKITVTPSGNALIFAGNTTAFMKIGGTITSFFDEHTQPDDQLHIDCYDGQGILNPTAYSLTFTTPASGRQPTRLS